MYNDNNKLVIFHKQIDLIQDCIKRMAGNSFLVKGWSAGLLTIAMVLLKEIHFYGVLLIILPIICLWYLDAFFLYTEKKYRKRYEKLLESIEANNFSDKYLNFYSLNPNNFKLEEDDTKDDIDHVVDMMLSPTLRVFYGSLILFALIVNFTQWKYF